MKYKRFSAFSAMIMLTAILAGCNNSDSAGIFPGNSSASESSSSSTESTPVTESGDVFCFEFSIDGETYKFPLKYSDMEKNGWSYKNGGGEKPLKPNQYLIGLRMENGDLSMSVQPINLTDSNITANEANIGKLTLDSNYIKPDSHTVNYAGIVLGKSKMDDVLAAFGEPSSKYENEKHPTVTYKMKTNVTVKFSFDNTKGGIVDEIDIQNFSKNL